MQDYEGFVETDNMRELPWPPLLLHPLLEHTLRIPWASSDCRPYTVPPLFDAHRTSVPAPLAAAALTLPDLPSCAGRDPAPIPGSYYPAHPLDVLWPEWNYPQPHGRPLGGRHRFLPHGCEWRHAGMRPASAHRCTRRRASVLVLGDSHGRNVHDGMAHRLNGTRGVLHSSPKIAFKEARVGQVELAFQWDPRGDLALDEPDKLCRMLVERRVDVFFASIGFHLAIDQPVHVFLARLDALSAALDRCAGPAPHHHHHQQHHQHHQHHHQHQHHRAPYAGPRTRVLLTPPALPPRQDAPAVGSRQKSTNARLAYWAERARGWAEGRAGAGRGDGGPGAVPEGDGPRAAPEGDGPRAEPDDGLGADREDGPRAAPDDERRAAPGGVWAVLDAHALTAPLAWEPMFSDRLHYLVTDAHEAMVDEALGRAGVCPEGEA
ncbi:hypothetical protein HDZ31DRAFT_68776 [Schizophyllum fasciatum]